VNIYVVTEGESEAIVYRHWIPLINEKLKALDNISDISANGFYIISGKGFPYYYNIR